MTSDHEQEQQLRTPSLAPRTGLPTLELPPIPFGARARSGPALPTGSSIDEIIRSLAPEKPEPLDRSDAPSPLIPASQVARPTSPLTSFHEDVDRRTVERRAAGRGSVDRRKFASNNLAAPALGPSDPRPLTAPSHLDAPSITHVDPRMPELPTLDPARAYELPTRGIADSTIRTSRPGIIVSTQAETSPPPLPPASRPAFLAQQAPPVQHAAAQLAPPVAPVAAPAALIHSAQPHPNAGSINNIYGSSLGVPVGRLEPWEVAVEPSSHPVHVEQVAHVQPATHAATPPASGPAGPAMAPGLGLDPATAAVAAAPSAWYGDPVLLDDELLVWNGASARGGQAHAAHSQQTPQSQPQPSATGTASAMPASLGLAAGDAAAAAAAPAPAAAASSARRGRAGSLLRSGAVLAAPAACGVGIAFAINRFVL